MKNGWKVERGWDRAGVKGDGLIDAGEEEDGGEESEGEGGGDAEDAEVAAGAEAEGDGGGEAVEKEEGGLVELDFGECDAEDVFVNDGGSEKGGERSADWSAPAAGGEEDVF